MSAVVLALMTLVGFCYALKQTFRPKWAVACSAAVGALFVGLAWPYAIEQSKTQLADWLADTARMLDVAVVLTIEVALQMAFCILAAHIQTSGPMRRRTVAAYRLLRWFPGLLVYPLLYGLLVAALFALPGLPFARTAWTLAGAVCAAIPTGAWALRRLLPEKDIRLELLFLSHALVALLGVVATVNGRIAVAATGRVDWTALAGVAALALLGLGGGAAAYLFKQKRTFQKNHIQ